MASGDPQHPVPLPQEFAPIQARGVDLPKILQHRAHKICERMRWDPERLTWAQQKSLLNKMSHASKQWKSFHAAAEIEALGWVMATRAQRMPREEEVTVAEVELSKAFYEGDVSAIDLQKMSMEALAGIIAVYNRESGEAIPESKRTIKSGLALKAIGEYSKMAGRIEHANSRRRADAKRVEQGQAWDTVEATIAKHQASEAG